MYTKVYTVITVILHFHSSRAVDVTVTSSDGVMYFEQNVFARFYLFFFCIKQIDFMLSSSVVTFCSSHAMMPSVIYYSTDARKNEIHLLNKRLITKSQCMISQPW